MSTTRVSIDDTSSDLSSSLLISNHANIRQRTVLTHSQVKRFCQHIEKEYTELQRSEAGYRYYINEQSLVKHARRQLDKAPNG